MPPISKIEIDLATKSCTASSRMGFCQQNQQPQQKEIPNKDIIESNEVVCSRDQIGEVAIVNLFPKKKEIENHILMETFPDSCNIRPSFETSIANSLAGQTTSNGHGNYLNNVEQNNHGADGHGNEEASCELHSSTCSSLSSLAGSDNELGRLNGNITEENINKTLIDVKSSDAAPLCVKKTENSVSAITKDIKVMKIKEINNQQNDKKKTNCEDVSLKDFSFMQLLGKGAFGHVVLVSKKNGPDPNVYALKMIPKDAIDDNEMYKVHFNSERKAMELVRNGLFLPTLYYAFQTLDHLYLVMDFASGGQLLQQFIGKNVLLENHMRVYLAELLVAVDFLHNRGIVHRDIKPENILLDKHGHVMLIDFGLCRVATDPHCQGVVGTQPYIAPEILKRLPHDRMADFWSLGVLGFEMVAGEPPFSLELSDEMLKKAVLEKEPWFSAKMFHKPCKALLSGLMQKNPKQRLGAVFKGNMAGMKNVMGHKFFKCIDWAQAEKGKLKPPNIPGRFICPKKKPLVEPKDSGFRCHFEDYSYSWLRSAEDSS